MSRENTKGTSFCGLGLEKDEEKKLKKHLADQEISAKKLMRRLIREYIKAKNL
jgi:hypothetical protein